MRTYSTIKDLDDQLLSHEDAADLVGIKLDGLNYWHRIGEGPPFLVKGRSRVYLRDDVLEWKARMAGRLRSAMKRRRHG